MAARRRRPHRRVVPRGEHRAQEPRAELVDRTVERALHDAVGAQRHRHDLGDERRTCRRSSGARATGRRSARRAIERIDAALVAALAELRGGGREDAGLRVVAVRAARPAAPTGLRALLHSLSLRPEPPSRFPPSLMGSTACRDDRSVG